MQGDERTAGQESGLTDALMENMAAALCHAHKPYYFMKLSLKLHYKRKFNRLSTQYMVDNVSGTSCESYSSVWWRHINGKLNYSPTMGVTPSSSKGG